MDVSYCAHRWNVRHRTPPHHSHEGGIMHLADRLMFAILAVTTILVTVGVLTAPV